MRDRLLERTAGRLSGLEQVLRLARLIVEAPDQAERVRALAKAGEKRQRLRVRDRELDGLVEMRHRDCRPEHAIRRALDEDEAERNDRRTAQARDHRAKERERRVHLLLFTQRHASAESAARSGEGDRRGSGVVWRGRGSRRLRRAEAGESGRTRGRR